MDIVKLEIGLNEGFQIDAVKREPAEMNKCSSRYCKSSPSVDQKHFTDSYQDQNEKLDAKNLNSKDSSYSEVLDSSPSQFNTSEIKNDEIDIFYEDIKRETGEELSEPIRSCEVCYRSIGGETDFFKSTSYRLCYRSECTCQQQNESQFYNMHGEDMTLDVKQSVDNCTTDSELKPLEIQEVTKEQETYAALQRRLAPPMEKDKMKLKSCSEPLDKNLTVSEKKIHCKSCSKSFSQMSSLKVHERVHTGEKPYNCKFCSKSFSHTGTLKRHERSHTGEKLYNCKLCSKSFGQMSHLKVHERSHTGEKPYNCKLCSKSFGQMSHLKVHERIHTGENLFYCKLCSKFFMYMGTLKVHERIHTGEKPFNCKFCSKSFSRMSNFKVHERVHTGKKPFHCKLCSKSFCQPSHLKVHARSHTGEKPFHCKLCSKSFCQPSHLKVHARSHTGEKPFHCKFCSKSFNQKHHLKRHEKTHW